MSRINLGIEVWRLTNEQLLAEHREIKRVCDVYRKIKESGRIVKVPKDFCLGTGHVMYFVYKPCTTLQRYIQLYDECKKRGFDVENYSKNWDVYQTIYDNQVPVSNDVNGLKSLQERIKERLLNSTKIKWHYTKDGKTLSIIAETACDLLTVKTLEDWN